MVKVLSPLKESGVQPASYLECKDKHFFAFEALFLLKSAIICINLLCGKLQEISQISQIFYKNPKNPKDV